LAPCTGLEPVSLDRQSSRLTRGVTGQLVSAAGLEPARRSVTPSRRCVYRFRHADMEDQAGFEPAVGLSHRIKSPTRSAATVTGPWFGGCGGTRTRDGRSRATRLKVWPVRRSGHTSGAFVCVAHCVSSLVLVVEEGIEPSATRLSAGALAIRTLCRFDGAPRWDRTSGLRHVEATLSR
jgi:hypothetical protein